MSCIVRCPHFRGCYIHKCSIWTNESVLFIDHRLCVCVCVCVCVQYPVPESHILKSSRIGKAVMLLYRHPKETRKNKEKAGKIISECVHQKPPPP